MITLRPATLQDLALLQYWDQQAHVIAADPDEDWDWKYELPRNVSWREQLIAEHAGEAIGMVQIIDPTEEESHYWGKVAPHKRAIDIWIGEEKHLGKGWGTQMMQLALARCFAPPEVTEVWIDPLVSNVRAIRFYQRLGFRLVEERRFGQQICAVHALSRAKWLATNHSKDQKDL